MKNVELYDVITLASGQEYAVLRILEEEDHKYFLLAESNDDEVDMGNIRIVEEIMINGEPEIADVTNQELLEELSSMFISALDLEI